MNRIIVDMPPEEYHAHPAISKSGLDQIAKSPAHYKWWRENDEPDTDALRVGSAFHTLLLEPESFNARCLIWSGRPRNTKAGKDDYEAAEQEAAGRLLIKQSELEDMQAMARAIKAHPAAAIILNAKGRIEPSLFWQDVDTGVECRCRPDWLRDDGLIVDLKTTICAKPEEFERSAFKNRYPVQAKFYSDGYEAVTGKQSQGFVFIAVEKEPPYGVCVFVADQDFIATGLMQYRRDLERYAECAKTGEWPCYPETIVNLSIPPWALKQLNNGAFNV